MPERYRLHTLLRAFAREQLKIQLYDAELRMAAYYCEVAKKYGDRLQGGEGLPQADVMDALEILDRERSNIFAGRGWAIENETREARELTRDYVAGGKSGAMGHYFSLRANWAEWIEWSEHGLAACQALADERGEAAIAGNLGSVYAAKGEWDTAIEWYQKALATLERLGDVHGAAQTYTNLGSVYAAKGEWDTAIEWYQKALATLERLGDVVGISSTAWNLGLAFKEQGKLKEAIEWMEKCVVIEEKLGHPDARKDRAEVEELKRKMGNGGMGEVMGEVMELNFTPEPRAGKNKARAEIDGRGAWN